MSVPGKQSEKDFEENIFKTWLEYRASLGQSRADVIREVNSLIGTKFDNTRFYQMLRQQKPLSPAIIAKFIIPDLPQLYRYYFTLQNYQTDGLDFNDMARKFRPIIKCDQ